MANPLKYTDIHASSTVYVDSQCGYHFTIFAHAWAKKGWRRWVYQTGFGWEDFPAAPAYVTHAARESILKVLKDPETKFHEYDRDRNERYTNLRYHDAAMLRFQVRALSLSIARENPPAVMPRLFNQVVFPTDYDPTWGAAVWLPKLITCSRCGAAMSDHLDKTLAYYHAPVAVCASCYQCEGDMVCLLNDEHQIVETYFEHFWDVERWNPSLTQP